MQLKAFIKNQAAKKHISAQLVMQNYMLERFLERISVSKYKRNFILKGGFLISAIVGLDTRTTIKKSGSEWILTECKEVIEEIEENQDLKNRWDKYRKDFEYAKEITYESVIEVLKIEMNVIK